MLHSVKKYQIHHSHQRRGDSTMVKTKDYVTASVNVAFAGVGIRILNDTDLPQSVKSLGNIAIGSALIKDTGKKLKVF